MDRIIEKLDSGWWIVSHEQKLWLPHGELPYGDAARFDLIGQRALPIGEWEGETVWLVQQQRRHDMGSVRQVIDQMLACFNWPDAAYSWRSSIARINSAATAAIPCTRVKRSGRCSVATAVNVITRKLPRA